MSTMLAQTSLHHWHSSHGGRMVDFAGWSMPVQYSSIVTEHSATRQAAALFDVSHMGRLRFDGGDVAKFLDCLVTRRLDDMQPGQVRYALVTNDHGGILDDVLVYYVAVRSGRPYYSMVVNASNREKIFGWIQARICNLDVTCSDETLKTAMIAVQGPLSVQLLGALVDVDAASMVYYTCKEALIHEHPGVISRTGYTGEDGFELIVPGQAAEAVWQTLLDRGTGQGVTAAGLGARDTLRLEAGMPLYGHELTEMITPLQAGLGFAVNLAGRTFPGREALAKIKLSPPELKRVGLKLTGKRAAREHYPVSMNGQAVGEVTSGTYSPTLDCPIAMAYVHPAASKVGTKLQVDIRGTLQAAEVVKLPFYRHPKIELG